MVDQHELTRLKQEFDEESARLANWWSTHAPDYDEGGFYGEISATAQPIKEANKSVILHSRILWFFSALYLHTGNAKNRAFAEFAFEYFTSKFRDSFSGGVFWMLDYKGNVIECKKHIYAQCFGIYALATFAQIERNTGALALAEELQELIEVYSWDETFGGYWDAFDRDWTRLNETSLGESDKNYPKKMNTHLHLLEAYTALYKAAPHEKSKFLLEKALRCFCDNFVDGDKYYLNIFFDKRWNNCSTWYSFGHEIESSWLINEALDVLSDKTLSKKYNDIVDGLTRRCYEFGQGYFGEFRDEYRDGKGFNNSRVWWIQAEALVGFLNAYQRTEDLRYFLVFIRVWQFIKCSHLDTRYGEWNWYSNKDHKKGRPKACNWKGPYHNGRSVMQVSKRLFDLIEKNTLKFTTAIEGEHATPNIYDKKLNY